MQALWQDLRYSLRSLSKNPGFTTVALLTLALGIGANVAMFSVVDAVLLRPLPFQHPERIVNVLQKQEDGNPNLFSVPDYQSWKEQNTPFEELAARQVASFSLSGRGQPERLVGARVSKEFFAVVGVRPILGRTFLPDEDRPGGKSVVILGYGLWQRLFGGGDQVLGKEIRLSGSGCTIIGVMPPRFDVLETGEQLWTPLQLDSAGPTANSRGIHQLGSIARLRPGLSVSQAQAQLDTIAGVLRHGDPEGDAGRGVTILSLRDALTAQVRPALLLLLGAVGFVLLLAAANVANLLLARAADRKNEIAIRISLGASSSRLIRQLLTESILLSLLGGTIALVLAYTGLRTLVAANPVSLPRVQEIGLNWTALLFALGMSLFAGIVFGLVPSLRASREGTDVAMKEGARGSGRMGRDRKVLVISEMALTIVLLVAAGLSLRSLWLLLSSDPGFDSRGLLTMQVALPDGSYQSSRIPRFYHSLLERLKELSEVQSFAIARDLPLDGANPSVPIEVEGQAPVKPDEAPRVRMRAVSSNYFQTLGIPLVGGRDFTDQDAASAPSVVVISRSLAVRFWPGQNPLGKRLKLGMPGSTWATVVGVANDVKHIGLEFDTQATVYLSYLQVPEPMLSLVESNMTLALRSAASPTNLTAKVREALASLDADVPLSRVQTMSEIVETSLSSWRLNLMLLGSFALLALALAVVGLYGVLAHSVSRRTREIGIRMALGADRLAVLRLVLGEGLRLILAGAAIGLGAALALGRVLSSLLYGIQANDPVTFAGVTALLTVVALIACYVPAYRATRVSPMAALRYE